MRLILIIASAFLIQSCIAPRGVIESGKVTEKGHFKAGYSNQTNISTAFPMELYKAIRNNVETYAQQDTIIIDDTYKNFTKTIVSYSLDPIMNYSEMYLRYGLFKNFDCAIKYSGNLAFDAQYQYAGTSENFFLPTKNLNSSIGIQYSQKKYKFPSYFGDIQDLLGYSLSRRDIMIKALNSIPFGENEKVGHFGFGLICNFSNIKYGFSPERVLLIENASDNTLSIQEFIERETNYYSIGSYFNVSAGYKYAYITAGLSVYYQNYGKYYLYDDIVYSPSGLTFVPHIGLQFKF